MTHLSALCLYRPDDPHDPLLEFFEFEGPSERAPLYEKIEELCAKCDMVLGGTSADIDLELSWYSVVWYPIPCYRSHPPASR